MDFDSFIFILKLKGVPTEAVMACKDFAVKTVRKESLFNKDPKDDLGYAELKQITSKDQSIGEIVDCIWHSCFDFDSAGRDISKKRYAQLCAKPHKGLLRRVAKSYYLHHFNVSEEPVYKDDWQSQVNLAIKTTDPEALYKMNAFKEYVA